MFIYLFTYFPSQPQFLLPPLLPVLAPLRQQHLPISPPNLFRKGEASHGYQPCLDYQVAVRIGAASLEARRDSPVGGKSPKGGQQSQRLPLLPLLGLPHEDQDA